MDLLVNNMNEALEVYAWIVRVGRDFRDIDSRKPISAHYSRYSQIKCLDTICA
jgi:hypothetical protein